MRIETLSPRGQFVHLAVGVVKLVVVQVDVEGGVRLEPQLVVQHARCIRVVRAVVKLAQERVLVRGIPAATTNTDDD